MIGTIGEEIVTRQNRRRMGDTAFVDNFREGYGLLSSHVVGIRRMEGVPQTPLPQQHEMRPYPLNNHTIGHILHEVHHTYPMGSLPVP